MEVKLLSKFVRLGKDFHHAADIRVTPSQSTTLTVSINECVDLQWTLQSIKKQPDRESSPRYSIRGMC